MVWYPGPCISEAFCDIDDFHDYTDSQGMSRLVVACLESRNHGCLTVACRIILVAVARKVNDSKTHENQ